MQAGEAPGTPDRHLSQGIFKHPFSERYDQAGFLGQRNEGVRAQQAMPRVVPADQRFHAADPLLAEADYRLIMELELVAAFQRTAQVVLERDPHAVAAVHLRRVLQKAVLALALDLVHRDVCIAEQDFGRFAAVRVQGDADADRGEEIQPGDLERPLQFGQHFGRNQRGIFAATQIRQQDGEFIAPLTCQRVSRAQARARAQGEVLEQLVAFMMAVGVIDQFEAVDVDEHHPKPLSLSFRMLQGHAQPILEQRPVGQPGEQIVKGLEGDGFLGLLAVGDVPRDARGAHEVQVGRPFMGGIDALGTEDGDDGPVLEMPDAVGLGLQPDFDVGARPVADATFVERKAGVLLIIRMHDQRIVLAEEFFPGVTEQCLHAAVHENEDAVLVERVDDVGGLFDQKAVQSLGVFEPDGHHGVFPLHAAAAEDAVHGVDQFLRIAMLADELEGAVAQRANGRVDGCVATEDHDGRRHMPAQHPFHDFQPVDVGQIEIEDEHVDVAAFQSAHGFTAGAAVFDAALWCG